MKYRIDPKVDCVFKALLGAKENCNLLVHFLNAMLLDNLPAPIQSVEIINPYNERDFPDDKLSIVDVKAVDEKEQLFEVEIQMISHSYLLARILYVWASIYSKQLQSGDNYGLVRPTYSIWLLAEDVIKTDTDYLHICPFLRDTKGRTLLAHGGIWLIELNKFVTHTNVIKNDHERWLQFFKSADQFDDIALPAWMNTSEMRQAMTTLRQFSEKEISYFRYLARQDYLRQQRTILRDREEAFRAREEALQRERAAVRERDAALQSLREKNAEIVRLNALLSSVSTVSIAPSL